MEKDIENDPHAGHSKWRERKEEVQREVRAKTVGYLLTALGLVAGLAWNEAITEAIKQAFPFGADSIWAKFIYAAVITLFVVIVSLYLGKLLGAKEK